MASAPLERYGDLWALKPTDTDEDGSAYGDVAVPAVDIRIDPQRWDALLRSGWRIVTPAPPLAAQLAAGDLPASLGEALQVWHGDDWALALVTWRLTVTLRIPPGPAERLLGDQGYHVIRRLPWGESVFSLRIPRDRQPFEFAAEVEATPGGDVVRARPELLTYWCSLAPPFETDTHYAKQWQWPKIGADQAWNTTMGAGIRIAVVDAGFTIDHPNIEPAVLDSSGNFPEDVDAAFEPGKGNVEPDDGNHGTLCAGMAAAHRTEQAVLVGAAPEAKLMLLSVIHWSSPENLARAIAYAKDPASDAASTQETSARADVLSCSLFPDDIANIEEVDEAVHDAVLTALKEAWEDGREGKGMCVFWAANNADSGGPEDVIALDEHTIVVGRTGIDDDYVGHSMEGLDLVAPGYLVVSTSGNYTSTSPDEELGEEADGTSFATPCVAGVAALVLAANREFTAAEVRDRILETCEKIPGVAPNTAEYGDTGYDEKFFGNGRVNAASAVASPEDHTDENKDDNKDENGDENKENEDTDPDGDETETAPSEPQDEGCPVGCVLALPLMIARLLTAPWSDA